MIHLFRGPLRRVALEALAAAWWDGFAWGSLETLLALAAVVALALIFRALLRK